MKYYQITTLFILGAIISASLLSACGVLESSSSVDCPTPTAGNLLQTDGTLGYCLLYPDSHTVVQLEGGNTEIVVGEVMNHIDPRVSIFAKDLGGRTLEQYTDEFLTGFDGFEIEQSGLSVSGEEAILLDGIPGQDFYRKIFVAHQGLIYQLQFAPYDPNLTDTFLQAEQLFSTVMDSFTFTTP